jgi:single-strand DNA-binding protein
MFTTTVILGRIGRKQDKNLPNGVAVSELAVATDKKIKNKQSQQYEKVTTWHNVTVYGSAAEFLHKYCGKGDMVLIHGENELQTWEGKDGKKQYKYYVKANHIRKIMDNQNKDGAPQGQPANNETAAFPSTGNNDFVDDDLPF